MLSQTEIWLSERGHPIGNDTRAITILSGSGPDKTYDVMARVSGGVTGTREALCREDGIAMVANLHSVSLAREYSDRIIAFRDGRIVFSDKPEQLTEDVLGDVYGEHFADF